MEYNKDFIILKEMKVPIKYWDNFEMWKRVFQKFGMKLTLQTHMNEAKRSFPKNGTEIYWKSCLSQFKSRANW